MRVRSLLAMVLIGVWIVGSLGCATTPQGQREQQAAAAGGALGAITGGLIGYAIGGEKGAIAGAITGAALGALSGWAYEKRQQAMREAAKQNRRIVIVKEDKTEKVIAEPVDPNKIIEENGKKYREVKVQTYKVNPKTQKEEITSDTIERVPLE